MQCRPFAAAPRGGLRLAEGSCRPAAAGERPSMSRTRARSIPGQSYRKNPPVGPGKHRRPRRKTIEKETLTNDQPSSPSRRNEKSPSREMMMWSRTRMSKSAAARTILSVSTRSCGLASAAPEGWLWIRISCVESSSNARLTTRRWSTTVPLHAALTHALPLDDAVRTGKIEHPALLVRKPLQQRSEQTHRVVARADDLHLLRPRSRDPAAQFGACKQHARPRQPQSADHPQPRFGLARQPCERSSRGAQQRLGQCGIARQHRQKFGIVERLGSPRGPLIEQVFHANE